MGYIDGLLSKNEKIIVHTRKHWIALIPPVAYTVFFLTVILAGALAVGNSAPPLRLPLLSVEIFPIIYMVFQYLKWWNEEYFVTNRRVIQSEGIINKRVIDSSLEKVNDVVLSQSWIGRVMDYGDVEILTASEIGVNNLRTIQSPVLFKTEMLNQKEALGMDEPYRGSRPEAEEEAPDLLGKLEKLWKEGVLTDEEFEQKKKQLRSKK